MHDCMSCVMKQPRFMNRERGHYCVGGHRLVRGFQMYPSELFAGMKSKAPRTALPLADRTAYRRLEDVVGCKWSAAVLAAIGRGVARPGQLERFIPGISTKILNERLRKLVDFHLITRTEISGKVPRTEYALTPTGLKLTSIIESIRDLDEEHQSTPSS
jgi:DNA-binding HxlR family transcriptional regulator